MVNLQASYNSKAYHSIVILNYNVYNNNTTLQSNDPNRASVNDLTKTHDFTKKNSFDLTMKDEKFKPRMFSL